MDWIECNGASLRYELSGHGDRTLVLVHELGGALESYDEVLPALSDRFRVLRYDQRGCGLSEKARGTLSAQTHAADLACLLDALALRQPVALAGTALGAGLAIIFTLAHPARVAQLIATSPALGVTGDRREQVLARADAVEANGMRSVVDSSLDRSYPEVLRDNQARYIRYRQRWLANDPGSFAAINRMLASMDPAPPYADIGCPTLVLSGVHDALRPPASVEEIARQIPNASYKQTDAGHFMAVQNPDLFVREALTFLG
ncbi:MAG: alpha/beta fold hydrolase [Gammaproteobacteria bacterium]|nr:alpha/beta fold hydrolase [Gammaproteobacteria bacterium]